MVLLLMFTPVSRPNLATPGGIEAALRGGFVRCMAPHAMKFFTVVFGWIAVVVVAVDVPTNNCLLAPIPI